MISSTGQSYDGMIPSIKCTAEASSLRINCRSLKRSPVTDAADVDVVAQHEVRVVKIQPIVLSGQAIVVHQPFHVLGGS